MTSTSSSDISDQVRDALLKERQERGMSESALAVECDMPVTTFNDFMAGHRNLGPSTWRAIYRSRPALRWLLEEYQRRAAMADTQPDSQEARQRAQALGYRLQRPEAGR